MAKSKWINDVVAKELIERIAKSKLSNNDQVNMTLSYVNYDSKFDSVSFSRYKTLLIEQVRFNDDIPKNTRNDILSNSLFKAADQNKLNSGFLSGCIKAEEQNYLKKELIDYSLITGITLVDLKSKLTVKTKNSEIIISKYFPLKFKASYKFDEINSLFKGINIKRYSWVTINIKARCINSAAELALNELNYYLGIINLRYNFYTSRTSIGKADPINTIRKYPYHSLHYASGESATDTTWYEPKFSSHGKVERYSTRFKEANKCFKDVNKDIIKTDRYRYFSKVLNMYTDTLESNDMNKSFLNLWTILEMLTFTMKDNYDVTIQRAMLLFKDKFLTKQELNLLRDKRNMAIHSGSQLGDAEKYSYMLLSYVNELFIFILNIMIKVNDDDSIKKILDLPPIDLKLKDIENKAIEEIKRIAVLRKIITIKDN